MEMNTDTTLNCSCPKCGASIVVPMKHSVGEDGVMKAVSDMMGDELKLVGSYTFMGELKCSCGSSIISCLTVSAQSV